LSLKVFHLFFIAVSSLLALGFGIWGVYFHVSYGNPLYLTLGVLSLAATPALVYYGIRFRQRFRHFSSL